MNDGGGRGGGGAEAELLVRSAAAADTGRLVQLLRWGASRPGKEDGADLRPYLRALAELAGNARNRVLVAESAGEVIGVCQVFAVRELQEHGGLCAEVESLHVHPDHRGRGIGRALLDAAVQLARECGCFRVQLTSNKTRTDAHRFYERAGFTASHEGFKLLLADASSPGTEPLASVRSADGGADGYEFDADPARIDLEAVWAFLSTHAYWGRWRSEDDVYRQVVGAWRVVGCYHTGSGRIVSFARAVSDGVALAYLADVYIEPAHRGRGLGKCLVETMITDGSGADFRWLLHTADAHDLYRQFGFRPADTTLLELPHASARPTAPEPLQ